MSAKLLQQHFFFLITTSSHTIGRLEKKLLNLESEYIVESLMSIFVRKIDFCLVAIAHA